MYEHGIYENKSMAIGHRMASAIGGLANAFENFKEANDQRLAEIERRGSADVIVRDKVDRINARLDEFETLNYRRTFGASHSRVAEEMLANLEMVVGAKALAISAGERKRRVNTLARLVVKNQGRFWDRRQFTPEQREVIEGAEAEFKAINATSDASGGALCPAAFVAEILRKVAESSPVRSIVRVRTASGRSIEQPKRTGVPTATRVLEQGTRSELTGWAWGSTEIGSPEMYTFVDVSNANLEDSAFDLERELSVDSSDAFSQLESSEFITGAGPYQLEGIVTNAALGTGIQSVNSGSATTVSDANGQANGLINLAAAIKGEYAERATWLLSRATLGSVRQLKDAQQNYIWSPGLNVSSPNQILGRNYAIFGHMPVEGAGTRPIAFGDFDRGYLIYDRLGLFLLRDPYTQATSGNTRIWFRRRVGGAVTLAEAIAVLKCAA